MSVYYTPPPRSRQPFLTSVLTLLHHGLYLARASGQRSSRENRCAAAGVLLALVMVLAIYLVLVDNMVQLENQRVVLAERAQEHHRCEMLPSRPERSQCLIDLNTQDAPASVLPEKYAEK